MVLPLVTKACTGVFLLGADLMAAETTVLRVPGRKIETTLAQKALELGTVCDTGLHSAELCRRAMSLGVNPRILR